MTVLAMIKDESSAKDNLKKSLSLLELDDSLDTKDFQTIQDALRILEREDHRRQSKISTISGSVSIGKILNLRVNLKKLQKLSFFFQKKSTMTTQTMCSNQTAARSNQVPIVNFSNFVQFIERNHFCRLLLMISNQVFRL